MSAHSIPPAIMAGITLFVGLFHFFVAFRRLQKRTDLAISITCLCLAAYQLGCVGDYNASSVAIAVGWQRLQLASMALGAVAFGLFMQAYSGRTRQSWFERVAFGLFVALAVAQVFDRSHLTWIVDRPLVKHVTLPLVGYDITYYEATPGILTNLEVATGIVFFFYALGLAIGMHRRGETRKARPVVVAMLIYFVGILSDGAVNLRLYEFPYIAEYSFMGLVVVIAFSLFDDVVEAAGTKRALVESEGRLATVIESSGVGLWDWDVDSDRAVFNEQFALMLGRSLDELEPRFSTWRSSIHADDRARVLAELAAHVAGRAPSFESEHRLELPEGRTLWVLERGRVVRSGPRGEALRATGTRLDITERKKTQLEREQLQEQLLNAQKLEAIGTLAGGVAHDMNNVLAGVLALAELLRSGLDPSDARREEVEGIIAAARRGRSLTSNLLGFARKGRYRWELLELNDLVREVRELLARTVPRSIEVRLELAEPIPCVEGDPGQLSQALMNVCINATEAIAGEGVITISTGVLTVEEQRTRQQGGRAPAESVFIRVVDSGEGMTREQLAHAFEPFFTTKAQRNGTGLGLSMVQGAIQSHGGWVSIESEPGQGATVTLALPASEKARDDREAPERGSTDLLEVGLGKTVLVVDDEPLIRNAARRMLEQMGLTVILAENGRAALERFSERAGAIDLVILDVSMPVMGGVECFKRLRELAPRVKVLICSGYAESGATESMLSEGAAGFLQKPFAMAEIRTLIGRLMLD